jgi:cell division protein ZapA
MPRQPVRVQIFNQPYTLLSDSDPREVQEIAHEIDELMGAISSQTSSVDSTRIAVLACFHLADKLRAAEKQLHEIENQSDRIAALLEDAIGPA